VKARELYGLNKYGLPLDPRKDRRKFILEAIEELLDALFYLEAQLAKKTRDQRYNESLKGRARSDRYDYSTKGIKRRKRYRSKPKSRELNRWFQRTYKKRKKIENTIL
jgi:hypothetical protein